MDGEYNLHAKSKLRNFYSAECACFAFLKSESCEFRIFKRQKVTAELEKIRIVTFQLFYNNLKSAFTWWKLILNKF